jgi:hypothetical protein
VSFAENDLLKPTGQGNAERFAGGELTKERLGVCAIVPNQSTRKLSARENSQQGV